jgi:hypothetical protein
MDPSITAIIAALTGGTGIDLELQQGIVTTGGYLLTVEGALITNVKPGQDAKGGATFEFSFEANGSFTLA